VAKPDPAAAETDEPVFRFTIYADVTDATGETRTDQRTIQAGFATLQAELALEAWQTDTNPVVTKLMTTTLDGEPQAAVGKVSVFRLKEPPHVLRRPLVAAGYAPWARMPAPANDRDPADPEGWEAGALVLEKEFATDAAGKAQLAWPLGAGLYRAQLETKDRFGRRVSARRTIHVLKPDAAQLEVKIPHLVAALSWSLEPG